MRPLLYQWRLTRDNPFHVEEQRLPPRFANPNCDMHSAVHLGILLRGRLGLLTEPLDIFFTASWEPHGNLAAPAGAELLLLTVQPEAVLECVIDARDALKDLLYLPAGTDPERFRRPELRQSLKEFLDRYAELRTASDSGAARQQLWLEIAGLFHAAARLDRNRGTDEVRRRFPRLQPVFAALAARASLPLTAAAAARLCGMSESYFGHTFRACTGISFARYELAFRLNGAAAELHREKTGVKQLAAEWGFYDASHFCRSYRKHFGVTPCRDRES